MSTLWMVTFLVNPADRPTPCHADLLLGLANP